MRILNIIASVNLRGGGPIEGILQLSRLQLDAGWEVEIASLDHPDEPSVRSFPVEVHALGVRRAPTSKLVVWMQDGLKQSAIRWLKENIKGYDAVIVHGLWNYSVFAARRALVGGDVPYAVFTHGMLDPWFKKSNRLKSIVKQLLWWFSEGPLLNHANAVLFTTEEERLVSRHAFWPYRVKEKVVGFGTSDVGGDPEVQLAAFRAAVPELGGREYLLFLSRLHPKKGCDLLIDAFAEVAAKCPRVDLVMAGPDQVGWQIELGARAEALGIGGRIHWPGMLRGDVKWGAYRGCEAFVLPSHQENFGVVVAEAMAVGKPVLISEKVQIWREVVAGGGGFAETDNAEGTARALDRFLSLSESDRLAMGKAARSTFLDRFDIRKTATNLNDFLEEVVSDCAT